MQARWDRMLLLPFLFMGAVFVLPIVLFLQRAIHPDLGNGDVGAEYTLANFTRLFTDPFYLRVLWRTVSISIAVALVTILLAYPLSYFLVRVRYRWKHMVGPLLLMTAFVTVAIRSIGWIILLGREGPLNGLLRGLRLIAEPVTLLGNFAAVVIGISHFLLPLVTLILMSVIRTIPVSMEENAGILGATRWRVFRRVILPLSLPGTFSAAMLAFAFAMGNFATTVLMGGGKVLTFPVLVYQEVMVKLRYAQAAATASVLLVLTVAIYGTSLVVYHRLFLRAGQPGSAQVRDPARGDDA